MARRLGPHQIEALALVCGFRRLGLTPRREERALIKRGLLREHDGSYCITPAGLRAVADEMDAGRLKDGIDTWAAAMRGKDDTL